MDITPEDYHRLVRERNELRELVTPMKMALQGFLRSWNICHRPALCVISKEKFEMAESVYNAAKQLERIQA